MNRILIDDKLDLVSNLENKRVININSDGNYLINKGNINYDINITNSNCNILLESNKEDVNLNINITNSIFYLNIVSTNINKENININIDEEKSKIELHNSVITDCYLESHINVLHNSSNTFSDIYNFGVTKNDGACLFDVVSKVPRNIKGCIVNQDSKIVPLNKTNKNEIKPVLLIDEFDTEAKHAAFIGKFDIDKLFYLQTRGLSKKESEDLLLNGYLFGMLKTSSEEKNELKEKYKKIWG